MSTGIPREPKGAGPAWTEERRRSDEGRQGLKGRPEASGTSRASGKKLAFIGLGIMGAPMAANLVKAGFDVAGYNRSPARIEQLVAAGGRGAADIATAVRDADVVATMVPDSPDVQAVLAGEGGVFEHASPGALIIDFSSIRPDVAAALAAEGAGRGFRMLDAPVSGGEQGAIEGVLSIMVGGAAADFEAAAPVFDAVGKTIVHVGPSGSGQTVKAANQLMVAGHLELLAEAIVFLEAYGVDTEAALRVLGGGLRRQHGAPAQGGHDAGSRLQARLPDRVARQGHGHRHRGGRRGRRGDPARGRRRAAGGLAEGARRRRAGSFCAAQAGRPALRTTGVRSLSACPRSPRRSSCTSTGRGMDQRRRPRLPVLDILPRPKAGDPAAHVRWEASS